MSEITKDPEYRPKWENRRIVIFGTLVFCSCIIGALTVFGKDTELSRDIAFYSFVLAGFDIAIYVFGATWDDLNFLKFLKR